MSRIFLSHSSSNNAEALALRDWLASQGWNDVFLDIDPVRGLVAADRWQKALNAAIGRCRAVIFLLSRHWLNSKHCISELDLAAHVGAQRIAVIVDKDMPVAEVPAGLGGERQVINLTRGGPQLSFTVNPPPERIGTTVSFPEEDLKALRSGLARLGLVGFETESFPWPPVDEPDRAPFRGLEALDVKDAGVFFGRDTDLVRAREHLIRLRSEGGRKLFVIQGASGSGKSSFMRAGLLPRLEREDRDFVTLPLIRPGTAALSGRTGLATALEQAFEKLRKPRPFGELLAALERDENALPPLLNALQVQAMERLVGDAKPQIERPPTVMLAIDQAEELFTPDAGQEAAKLRQHLAAALTRGPDAIALLTIRSDRFSLLQNDELLAKLLEPFNLPPMPATVYRDAILRPAARLTPPVIIHPALTEALIKDTAAEGADPLPLLAFTLERLYRGYGKAREGLVLKHYENLGGIAGSINAAIDEAFSKPRNEPTIPADRHERERLLEAAFVPALVDINHTNGEPVSRIAKAEEISPECHNLIQRLVNARLLVSDETQTGKEGKPATTYRVAHEALLRRWDWLSSVLNQRTGELGLAQLIERQAEAWDKARRAKSDVQAPVATPEDAPTAALVVAQARLAILKQEPVSSQVAKPRRRTTDRKSSGLRVQYARADEWLDLRGDRLQEALKLARRADFKRRLTGVPADYVSACLKRELKTKLVIRFVLSLVAMGALGGGAAYIQQLTERERFIAERKVLGREREVLGRIARTGVLEEAAERALKRGETFKECETCPEMVVVPAGEFMMGSPETERNRDSDEGPQRKVTIARPFAVGKFEVTFSEWEACVAGGGCTANKSPNDRGWGKGMRPVINVSWNDARQYVEWLSVRTGKTYRLLTEAEWEYATRAETTTVYSWGNEVGENNANCDGCGSQWDNKQTAPVGSFKPNAFGLHDMHGNVREWVQDCHGDYSKAPNDGSAAPDTANCSRVLRGGSWYDLTWDMRAADRNWNVPGFRSINIGFRVARVLPPART